MNVTIRKQSRRIKGKGKLEEDLEQSFYNPKVSSLLQRGLEKTPSTLKHSKNGALREDVACCEVTQ